MLGLVRFSRERLRVVATIYRNCRAAGHDALGMALILELYGRAGRDALEEALMPGPDYVPQTYLTPSKRAELGLLPRLKDHHES